MLNLLPYSVRDELKLLRINTALIKIIIVLLSIGVFIGVYFVNMKIQINHIEQASMAQVNQEVQQDSKRIEHERAVAEEAKIIQQDITSSSVIISQPSYYKLLTLFANSLPKGVIIKEISLSDQTLSSPVQIKMYATSSDAVSLLKESFARNSSVFTDLTIDSVSDESSDDTKDSKYTTLATVSLTINTGGIK